MATGRHGGCVTIPPCPTCPLPVSRCRPISSIAIVTRSEDSYEDDQLGKLQDLIDRIRQQRSSFFNLAELYPTVNAPSYRTVISGLNGLLKRTRWSDPKGELYLRLYELTERDAKGNTYVVLVMRQGEHYKARQFDREAGRLVRTRQPHRGALPGPAAETPALILRLKRDYDAGAAFLLAAKCYIDGWTNTFEQPQFVEPYLPPSEPAADQAVRKLKGDGLGDCFVLKEGQHVVGYSSLWCLDPNAPLIFDRDGNVPKSVLTDPDPGVFDGYVSGLRLMPPYQQQTDLLFAALEKSVVAYESKGVVFRRILVRAHHESVEIMTRRVRNADHEDDLERQIDSDSPVHQVTLLPWGIRDDARHFGTLREVYRKHQRRGGDAGPQERATEA